MDKILVVDDDVRIRRLLKDFLVNGGYDVCLAEDGEAAIERFNSDKSVSLIVLDIMMPKKDGWEVLQYIRQFSKIPVIMLTAKAEEYDQLKAFDLGVDEYVTKPFSPKVVVARIGALLRRSASENNETLVAGGIKLDKSAHVVTIDDKQIDLSFKEFELLQFFIENAGLALSREKILNCVWNYDYYGDSRTIDTHVKKLRSKLGDAGSYIKTIWGMGYKFEVDQ